MDRRGSRCAGQIDTFHSPASETFPFLLFLATQYYFQHDALSIVRSRLVQVSYAIRVSLIAGSLSSEVSVMLPLRIINSFSIDPPPSYPTPSNYPGVHAPVPLLPVQALDFATATSIPPVALQLKNCQGSHFRTMPDLVEPRTMSNEVIAPGDRGSDTTDEDDAGQRHIQPPQIIARLNEESSNVEATGHYPFLAFSSPPSHGSESSRSRLSVTHDRNVSDDASGDSEATDGIDIDDLTIDLLRKLNSDDEHESFLRSELDGDGRRKSKIIMTTADIPQAVGSRNESLTGPEDGLSSLPKDLAIHENITAITNCCHTSSLKVRTACPLIN